MRDFSYNLTNKSNCGTVKSEGISMSENTWGDNDWEAYCDVKP